MHSCHQGENTIALPTFIFPWAGKNFSVGKQKKKNKSAIKTHSNKEKKYPSEKKKITIAWQNSTYKPDFDIFHQERTNVPLLI